MSQRISSSLRYERTVRAMSQSRLAGLVGITRQSYSAIERGTSIPSADVAMRLARTLDTSVESLFRLPEDAPPTVTVELAGPSMSGPGPVRLVEIGGRRLGIPLRDSNASRVEPADGIGRLEATVGLRVELFGDRPPPCDLVVLGCDPSFELIAHTLRHRSRIEVVWIPSASRVALEGLARGHAHVAGIHLVDAKTRDPQAHAVDRMVPFPCTRFRFARWEQCLIVAPGNPAGIEGVSDLAREGIRFVNRESGSGSRILIDLHLEREGIPRAAVRGYEDTSAKGHIAVAAAVAGGLADVGVGIRAAALSFGLEAVLLEEEAYDLVIPDHFLELPGVQALLALLRTSSVRTQVEALGGYDVEGMGLPR